MSACGSDGLPSGPDDPGGGDGAPVTLNGGERLAWDQTSGTQAIQSYTFRFFVDGTESALSDVRCEAGSSSGSFRCSGLLPPMVVGLHSLEVAAVAAGEQSNTSVPLLVRVIATSVSGTPSVPTVTTVASAPPSELDVCVPEACYRARQVATGVGLVSAMAVVPGGRLFFIERGQVVRAVEDGQAGPPVLIADPARSRLIGLVVPPDFSETRRVFVAWAERTGMGEVLNVTRYREVEGSFGEAATIITGLPIPEAAGAPVAMDDQGLLYVALPADPVSGSEGTVLRFDADGRVPAANPGPQPAISAGYDQPSALAWDAANRQIWLTGIDPRMAPISLLRLPVSPEGNVGVLAVPHTELPEGPSPAPGFLPALAVSSDVVSGMPRLWLVAAPGFVVAGSVDAEPTLGRADLDPLGSVVSVAGSAWGEDVYIASAPGQAGSSGQIWLMTELVGR